MAKDRGSRPSKFPKWQEPEEQELGSEDVSSLMAEIDVEANQVEVVRDDTPTPVQEPPENPPAYTPPITERWGRLMSRVNHPLEVKTKEGAIRLSPRQIVRVDGNKLGDVPTGARFVPDRR